MKVKRMKYVFSCLSIVFVACLLSSCASLKTPQPGGFYFTGPTLNYAEGSIIGDKVCFNTRSADQSIKYLSGKNVCMNFTLGKRYILQTSDILPGGHKRGIYNYSVSPISDRMAVLKLWQAKGLIIITMFFDKGLKGTFKGVINKSAKFSGAFVIHREDVD